MELTDSFGRHINYLRLSITDRCNFRCRYCMPASGVAKVTHPQVHRFEELQSSARAAVALGIIGAKPERHWLMSQSARNATPAAPPMISTCTFTPTKTMKSSLQPNTRGSLCSRPRTSTQRGSSQEHGETSS